MKLSIIIVSYNENDYLAKAIESCMVNDYDYEIIIGDDGSNDGSIDRIAEYNRLYPEKIRYFVMDRPALLDKKDFIPSIRVSNVLKRAFELCQGEYITILSGDDINLMPERYEKQITFLDQNCNYDSCYVDYINFWNDGAKEPCRVKASVKESVFWAVQYIHISCFVFRRKCLENILDRFCDDTGLIYSILSTGKSRHLKIDGFGYRQRDQSIMHDADMVELNLIEAVLFQDCLNHGNMKTSSLARFYKPLQYLKSNRPKILESKYQKYILECSKYPNNILDGILTDSKNIQEYISKGRLYYFLFTYIRKINIIANLILSR